MAEMNAFERRVADALAGYAEEISPAVDAGAVAHRVALEHPRHGAGALAWRGVAIPHRAWVLLLLAALLAALVGGTLLVGSQLQRRLPAVVPPVVPMLACPAGTNPDEAGPVDQARPTDMSPAMAFDRHAGRLVALAASDVVPEVAETWTFDVCTNTWTRMHPNREPPSPSQLVYDVDSDLMIASDGTRMWAYDLKANTWTEKGAQPPISDLFAIRFYDPVLGHVVATGDDGDKSTLGLTPWSYDVETDTWTPIPQAEPPVVGEPHNERFAYDASVDRLVAYAVHYPIADPPQLTWARTWLFDLRTGTWSETGAVTPDFSFGIWGVGPSIAYDEAAERTVMLGQGRSAAYNATADRWETRYGWSTPDDWWVACGTRPECRESPSTVYDPVNERLIVFRGRVPTPDGVGVDLDDMLAFDTRSREWTVLLEASQPVTPSSD